MIARVKFEGVVKSGEKKYILPDFVDIHSPNQREALEMFKFWTGKGAIRGASGIFHPLGVDGEIRNIVVGEGAVPESGLEEKEVTAPKESGQPKPADPVVPPTAKPQPETKPKAKKSPSPYDLPETGGLRKKHGKR